ncbi:hypothetical protein IMZ48_45785 [Candidatus Bathyarchaeota archaeon]|nr:hypothetical protein [Candidatus Bathyarchaeota archaeon]
MRLPVIISAIAGLAAAELNTDVPPGLNITAVTAEAGLSKFQCWQFGPFAAPTEQGLIDGPISLGLGDVSHATFAIIPAGFDGGMHFAPSKQYVYIVITTEADSVKRTQANLGSLITRIDSP